MPTPDLGFAGQKAHPRPQPASKAISWPGADGRAPDSTVQRGRNLGISRDELLTCSTTASSDPRRSSTTPRHWATWAPSAGWRRPPSPNQVRCAADPWAYARPWFGSARRRASTSGRATSSLHGFLMPPDSARDGPGRRRPLWWPSLSWSDHRHDSPHRAVDGRRSSANQRRARQKFIDMCVPQAETRVTLPDPQLRWNPSGDTTTRCAMTGTTRRRLA